jgi:hypothetical protein
MCSYHYPLKMVVGNCGSKFNSFNFVTQNINGNVYVESVPKIPLSKSQIPETGL